jgi:hypothetical protein
LVGKGSTTWVTFEYTLLLYSFFFIFSSVIKLQFIFFLLKIQIIMLLHYTNSYLTF